MFYSSLQAAISHSIYSNVNLKVKQVICLEAIYHGRDVVAVLPTGYGKSVIFHLLPSLFLDKINYERGAAAHPVVISVWTKFLLSRPSLHWINCHLPDSGRHVTRPYQGLSSLAPGVKMRDPGNEVGSDREIGGR